MSSTPLVSIIVAMRDEEGRIGRCMRSLLAQDYPPDRLEILVYDGMSTDRSVEEATVTSRGARNVQVRANPGVTQARAWNMGITAAAGDIVGIASGHAEFHTSYVREAVDTLRRTGADMVGGRVEPAADSLFGRAIAVAITTFFGTGGAAFRTSDQEGPADTVFMGVARRDVWNEFRFDEEMDRNQDDELSYRLLDAGRVIICNPAIRSVYWNRASLRSLWFQYFEYGMWKVRVLQKHPRQTKLRHLAAPGLVLTMGITAVSAPFSGLARGGYALVASGYLFANVAASVTAGLRSRGPHALMLPVVFATLHFAYGVGFARGVIRFIPGAVKAWALSSIRRSVRDPDHS